MSGVAKKQRSACLLRGGENGEDPFFHDALLWQKVLFGKAEDLFSMCFWPHTRGHKLRAALLSVMVDYLLGEGFEEEALLAVCWLVTDTDRAA